MGAKLYTEDVRSVAFGSVTGSLADLGDPTGNPAKKVIMTNGLDSEAIVSWDGGATEGFFLSANSSPLVIDCAMDRDNNEQVPSLPAGAQFQIKHNGSAPSSGTFAISVIY